MRPFISIISTSKKTILLLCSVVALSLALFSSCAFAVPLQQTTLNTYTNVSIDSTFVQAKASLSIPSNALLNDLCDGSITKSHMFNLVSHQVNKDNQDSKTTILSANNQPINLDTASDTETIGYMLNYYKGFCYTYFYYDENKFVNDINNVSDADVYFCQNIAFGKSIKIKTDAHITIHLCGHVLSGKKISTSGVDNVQIIQVSKNANLTVVGSEDDTQANQAHTLSGFDENGKLKPDYKVYGGVINAGQEDDVLGIKTIGSNSTITLNDTTIFGCSDKEDEGAGLDIYGENTKLDLVNSHIQHCHADSGAGIYLDETAKNSHIYMTYSSIEYNHADDYGGGIYCKAEGVTIDDIAYNPDDETARSTISNNTADDAGGGICSENFFIGIYRLKFCNNNAYNGGGAYANAERNVIDACTFMNNTAKNKGGAVCVNAPYSSLDECAFTNNKANNGGGIYLSVSGYNRDKYYSSVCYCSFYNNTVTKNGGGAYVNSEHNIICNCNFSDNSSGKAGSALYDNNDDNTLENCTIKHNKSDAKTGAVYVCNTVDIKLEGFMDISGNTGHNVYLASGCHHNACIRLVNLARFDIFSIVRIYIEGSDDKESRIIPDYKYDKIDEFIINYCFDKENEKMFP